MGFKQVNRKEDTIKLLEYLLNEAKTNPEFEHLRLGQFLLNNFSEGALYYLESYQIKEKLGNNKGEQNEK